MSPHAVISISVAHMEELELKLILPSPDALALENGRSHQACPVERTIEPSATVITFKQHGSVFFCFTGRPAVDLVMFWSEHQSSILDPIDVFNHFAAIDAPDPCHFFPAQFATVCHEATHDVIRAGRRWSGFPLRRHEAGPGI